VVNADGVNVFPLENNGLHSMVICCNRSQRLYC